jgi:nucleotide-binding universal stress UspA family protein
MWQKLLMPLDGSISAEHTLSCAAILSHSLGTEIYLLRVCADEVEARQACWPYIAKMTERLQSKLGNFAANVHQRVAVGDVEEEALRYATESGIDSILITVRSLSELKSRTIVSEFVQKAGIPALIVQPQPDLLRGRNLDLFTRILLPLDGTADGESAIPAIAAITKRLKANILLLRLVEQEDRVHTSNSVDNLPLTGLGLDTAKVQARRYLYEKASRFYSSKAKVDIDTELGDPATIISERAREMDATLMAFSEKLWKMLGNPFFEDIKDGDELQPRPSFLIVQAQA